MNNCGGCGIPCGSGRICQNGQCGCQADMLDCNGSGVPSDSAHCGNCTTTCQGPEYCFNNTCGSDCSAGTGTVCGGHCSNTEVDVLNCGVCGHVCGVGQTCSNGVCVDNTGTAGADGTAGTGGSTDGGTAGTSGGSGGATAGTSGGAGGGTAGSSGGAAGSGAAGTTGAGGAAGGGGATCSSLPLVACPTSQTCDYDTPNRCGAGYEPGHCILLPSSCSATFAPVCGCDGRTYGNDCQRQIARIQKDHDGACATNGGVSCAQMTCGAAQACVHPSRGGTCLMPDGGGCPPGTTLSPTMPCCVPPDNPACVTIDASCESTLTCTCFSKEPCTIGSCVDSAIQGRDISCRSG